VVTIIYLLVNVAYFAALSTDEILVSSAVAESFAAKILGRLSAVVPIFVACSCIGGLNGCLFSTSRMFFVGAR
jgi:L-type amino acid transporter 5